MTDFLAAWGNCHLDGNPDNGILIIYPKSKEEATQPVQNATVEAAIETAPAQPQPSLQDEYDAIQHLLLDLATFAGAPSLGDRSAMVAAAKQNIQSLKDAQAKDIDTINNIKEEANTNAEKVTELMAEIRTLKDQKSILAEQVAAIEKEDSRAVTVGIAAQRELTDIKTGMAEVAPLVKSKKATWMFIGKSIIAMRSQYEATINELKKKLEKTAPEEKPVEEKPQPQSQEKAKTGGLFDWFSF